MYWNDNKQHNTPHIHAYDAEFHASFNFEGKMLRGEFPKTATKLVKKWIL
jgi:hypothetical protein